MPCRGRWITAGRSRPSRMCALLVEGFMVWRAPCRVQDLRSRQVARSRRIGRHRLGRCVPSGVNHRAAFSALAPGGWFASTRERLSEHYVQRFLDHANLSTTPRSLKTTRGMHEGLQPVEERRNRCTTVAPGADSTLTLAGSPTEPQAKEIPVAKALTGQTLSN